MTPAKDFQEKYYHSSDGLRLYYREYNGGNPDRVPLLCLHGLTRNSKDFDSFARYFSADRPVFSLDIRGRGQSEYDPDYTNYQIPTYVQDVLTFLERRKLDRVIAVGTSMGGLISMALGAIRPAIFTAIILNDIGPEIDPRGIERIANFVGSGIILPGWPEAIANMKTVNSTLFPDYDDKDWELFTRNTFREQPDGTIIADYDQGIGTAIRDSGDAAVPMDLWPLFTALGQIPIMVLRGDNSDILSPQTVAKMADIHPGLTETTIPHRAHTPDLREETSLREIRRFISRLPQPKDKKE